MHKLSSPSVLPIMLAFTAVELEQMPFIIKGPPGKRQPRISGGGNAHRKAKRYARTMGRAMRPRR